MKFKLSMTKTRFDKNSPYDMAEIVEFKKLGFKFRDHLSHCITPEGLPFFIPEDDEKLEIEITNLQHLIHFIEEHGKVVVKKHSIEIYNCWRE